MMTTAKRFQAVVLLLALFQISLSPSWSSASPTTKNVCSRFLTATAEELSKPKKSFIHNRRYTYSIQGTPIKSQCGYGGCWIYSTIAKIEQQLFQSTGSAIDLSEQFVIAWSLRLRVLDALNIPGQTIEQGGYHQNADWLINTYGIVPSSAWKPRIPFENTEHADRMIYFLNARIAKFHVDTTKPRVTARKFEVLLAEAKADLFSILDTYIGKMPDRIEFQGTQYSPITFAEKFIPKDTKKIGTVLITHEKLPRLLENFITLISPSVPTPHVNSIGGNQIVLEGSAESVSEAIVDRIKNNESVYLTFEVVNPFIDFKSGIMSIGAFETPPGFVPPIPNYAYSFNIAGGGHAVQIIGADIDPSTGKVIKFKIKNSWGTELGDHGYFHMYRDYFDHYARVVYFKMDVK